jgi:predicted transcriptional regulator
MGFREALVEEMEREKQQVSALHTGIHFNDAVRMQS